MKDYCDNCKKEIEQIDLGDGSFGCLICKTNSNIRVPFYCNKCDKPFWNLNDEEKAEYENNGAFVCSECINREMDEEQLISQDTQQIKEENPKPTNPPILNVEPPKFIPFCLFCRKELLPNSHGRKRLYCNKKCGTKYWIQNNKEKYMASVRIASREYQRRKQKKIVEARNKEEDILRAKMEKNNVTI